MGFFNKSNQSKIKSIRTTIISAGTTVTGKLNCEDNLHIDGTVKGSIICKGIITVGQTGIVESEKIESKKLLVSGICKAEIDADEVDILSMGKIEGKVLSVKFMIEEGGLFEGESHSRKANEESAAKQPIEQNKKEEKSDKDKKNKKK